MEPDAIHPWGSLPLYYAMSLFFSRLGWPGLCRNPSTSATLPAEAGKFPLMQMFAQGAAQPLQDRGFGGSQAAAVPELWFEAGDMHGDADDGYPVLPQPGFAPFVFMLQRHVPWADERLRCALIRRQVRRVHGRRAWSVAGGWAASAPAKLP